MHLCSQVNDLIPGHSAQSPLQFLISDTVTPATSTIFVLFDRTVFTTDVITFTFEVTRMTGGTIDCVSSRWCIVWMGVWQCAAYRVAMTAITAWVTPVIAGVAAIRTMAEAGRCPAIGCMAHVTLFRGAQMA